MRHRTGYMFKRGDNFYVAWKHEGKTIARALRDDNGQPITKKREAEVAKIKLLAPFAIADDKASLEAIAVRIQGREGELARLAEKSNPPLLVIDAWRAFLESPSRPNTGPDTLAVYEGQFGQFAKWMEKNYPGAPIKSVDDKVAGEYATLLNKLVSKGEMANGTFNKHVNVLMLVFRVLNGEAGFTKNPWNHPKKGGGITRKQKMSTHRRELTVDELRRVCSNAPDDLRALFALGVYSGMRLKDCTSLRWGEIDFTRNRIQRIPSKLAHHERSAYHHNPDSPRIAGYPGQPPPKTDPDYILPSLAHDYLAGGTSKRRIIDSIQDYFVSQGIRIYKPGTGPGTGKRAVVEVGFHSLRHSFVSICRQENVPLLVVEKIVGHSNPSMTRLYSHEDELASASAIGTLPYLLSNTATQPAKPLPEAILIQVRPLVEKLTPEESA